MIESGPRPRSRDSSLSDPVLPASSSFPPSVTIDRSRHELYAFWRNFVNLSRFMWGVRRVEPIDAWHARWIIGTNEEDELMWETTITEDRPDTVIAWCTVSRSRIVHAGRVEFHDAPGGATRVSVAVAYERLNGALAERFARLFHHNPTLQTYLELQRFKHLFERSNEAGAQH